MTERDFDPDDYPSKKLDEFDRTDCGKIIHALTIALDNAKREGRSETVKWCREQLSVVFKRQDELEEACHPPEEHGL